MDDHTLAQIAVTVAIVALAFVLFVAAQPQPCPEVPARPISLPEKCRHLTEEEWMDCMGVGRK